MCDDYSHRNDCINLRSKFIFKILYCSDQFGNETEHRTCQLLTLTGPGDGKSGAKKHYIQNVEGAVSTFQLHCIQKWANRIRTYLGQCNADANLEAYRSSLHLIWAPFSLRTMRLCADSDIVKWNVLFLCCSPSVEVNDTRATFLLLSETSSNIGRSASPDLYEIRLRVFFLRAIAMDHPGVYFQ